MELNDFNDLNNKVIDWAEERGIFDKATPIKQSMKTLEECGELIESIAANNSAGIRDAIGDIVVTLIIQCKMQNVDIVSCLEGAYNEIKDRKGKMENGIFVKDSAS